MVTVKMEDVCGGVLLYQVQIQIPSHLCPLDNHIDPFFFHAYFLSSDWNGCDLFFDLQCFLN